MQNYKQNQYYKCLYNAFANAFAAQRDTIVKNCYDNETVYNNTFYSLVAALDFCEAVTMHNSDDYFYDNLDNHFQAIRKSFVNKKIVNEQTLVTLQQK